MVLCLLLLSPCRVTLDSIADDGEDRCLPPCGVRRIVRAGVVLSGCDDVTDEEDVGVRGHRTVRVNDAVGVCSDGVLGEHPASGHRWARKFRLEHVVVHGPEGRVALDDYFVRDTIGSEFVEQGLGDDVELSGGHVWGNERLDVEAQRAQLEVTKHVVVDPVVGEIVEGRNALVEERFVGCMGEVDVEDEGGGGNLGERLDGGGKDDTISARSSTFESPIYVRVLFFICGDNHSVLKEDIECEDLIGT